MESRVIFVREYSEKTPRRATTKAGEKLLHCEIVSLTNVNDSSCGIMGRTIRKY
jgi:hypothetical protein